MPSPVTGSPPATAGVISLALGGDEITTTFESGSAYPCGRSAYPVTSGYPPQSPALVGGSDGAGALGQVAAFISAPPADDPEARAATYTIRCR